jgi:hypothetical protein
VRENDGPLLLSAEVSGSFRNIPIILEQAFTLVDERIAKPDIRSK